MDFDKDAAWITGALAALGSLGAGVWRWVTRHDSRADREAEDRIKRESALYERQDAQLDRAYRRNAELGAEIVRLEEDRDRGWGLARAWFDRAHDERHKHNATIQAAVGGRLTPAELLAREPPRLPEFTAVVPKEPPA